MRTRLRHPNPLRWPAMVVLLAVAGAACGGVRSSTAAGQSRPATVVPVPALGYSVSDIYPHDPDAFTQGLVFHEGFLYESTGLYGRSSLRKVRLDTGEVLKLQPVPNTYFAEGLAIWRDQLLQLTWQAQVGFVYDLATFELRRTFSYRGEGWGLTTDGTRLILSDGTPVLRFLDPETFQVLGTLTVRDGGRTVPNLNELEVVNGALLANVWQTDRILRIDLRTGSVTGHLDLERLRPQPAPGRPMDVLNGIAFDPATNRLFVTGKLWPRLYALKVAW